MTLLVPFPIIQIVDGNDVDDLIADFPFLGSLHFYRDVLDTPGDLNVSHRILCWDLSGNMPEYFEDQEFWYVVQTPQEVTCKKCLEWLHA